MASVSARPDSGSGVEEPFFFWIFRLSSASNSFELSHLAKINGVGRRSARYVMSNQRHFNLSH